MAWGYWGGYKSKSKAAKQRDAKKAKAALMKQSADSGETIEPVLIAGGNIARSWWGKSWNKNLERYADYSNRLPRGRSYVRNGSVLDLKILPNKITAVVAGSRPQPYKVEINILSMERKSIQALIEKSRSSLDSMQTLLAGEFPGALKDAFFEKGSGLFPSPKEIKLSCSCPDWAVMCKHVAAALYGVSARLDNKPELFFALRGIAIEELVGSVVKEQRDSMLHRAEKKSGRIIDADTGAVSEMFGIAVDAGAVASVSAREVKERKSVQRIPKTPRAGSPKQSSAKKKPVKKVTRRKKPR